MDMVHLCASSNEAANPEKMISKNILTDTAKYDMLSLEKKVLYIDTNHTRTTDTRTDQEGTYVYTDLSERF